MVSCQVTSLSSKASNRPPKRTLEPAANHLLECGLTAALCWLNPLTIHMQEAFFFLQLSSNVAKTSVGFLPLPSQGHSVLCLPSLIEHSEYRLKTQKMS